ncbi:hypothetical protein OH76DRAFT_1482166 [Lentinus brumalis]|uniref:Ribosomal protein L15 n=1 Tax=Lentinus brumalis TaxID=2498619 RepID=A0A371DE73_9APHY|nr:hypothetical protein OH76DRAFT_1482166 [Polyporus brumalis]
MLITQVLPTVNPRPFVAECGKLRVLNSYWVDKDGVDTRHAVARIRGEAPGQTILRLPGSNSLATRARRRKQVYIAVARPGSSSRRTLDRSLQLLACAAGSKAGFADK